MTDDLAPLLHASIAREAVKRGETLKPVDWNPVPRSLRESREAERIESFGELPDWRPASTAVEQRIACLTVIAMLESAKRIVAQGIDPTGFLDDALAEATRLRDLLEAK